MPAHLIAAVWITPLPSTVCTQIVPTSDPDAVVAPVLSTQIISFAVYPVPAVLIEIAVRLSEASRLPLRYPPAFANFFFSSLLINPVLIMLI